MIIFWIFVFIHGAESNTGATPYVDFKELHNIEALPNVAAFGDAQHRGPWWEQDEPSGSKATDSYDETSDSISSSSIDASDSTSGSDSVSSVETEEKKIAKRVYRTCTPCPEDMLKKHKNMGIKWICAGYQRARRSFKSICMMRYRNCQDGTMFVKLYEPRCRNDSYHGRNWFYNYRV